MTTIRNILIILTVGMTFQLFGQTTSKDTIFISKEMIYGELHSIFIDNNKHSKFYDRFSYFNSQHLDDEISYKYSIVYLKENNLTLTKTKPVIPWTNWVTLKQYKGNFYVYAPCNNLFEFGQSVNDSTFIDWTGEGLNANKIIDQRKIDDKTYEFVLTGIYNKYKKIIIHIIDNEKGIAVFEQTTNGTDKIYYLMIAADKIKSVPIIVNDCPKEMQPELDFDEIDFKKLMTTK